MLRLGHLRAGSPQFRSGRLAVVRSDLLNRNSGEFFRRTFDRFKGSTRGWVWFGWRLVGQILLFGLFRFCLVKKAWLFGSILRTFISPLHCSTCLETICLPLCTQKTFGCNGCNHKFLFPRIFITLNFFINNENYKFFLKKEWILEISSNQTTTKPNQTTEYKVSLVWWAEYF